MVEFNGKNIIIMSCSKCNADCKHCYIEYDGDFSCEELEILIDSLKDKYNISLNGSELMLMPGYLKILKKLNQDRVLTNGLIIHNNSKLLSEMKENGIRWIGMSYHFTLHDIVSCIDKQIVIDNIKELKKQGFSVEIMTTISSVNYKDVEDMVQQAVLLEADCIRFTNLFNEGRAENLDNDLILTDEQINTFFDKFYDCKKKYAGQILIRRSGTFSRDFRKEYSSYYCPCMEETVAIAPNYKVYPCPFLIKEGYEIGKLENGKVYLDSVYENDKTTCMLHEVLNRGKVYVKKRYES